MNTRTFPILAALLVAALCWGLAPARAATGPNPAVNYDVPNWGNSPILTKFMDALPGLGPANKNNLGQYLPVANPDTITYPGSDYYEIALVEYSEKMHSQLPRTKLRGYVQINKGTNPVAPHLNTVAPAPVHYLGPIIVAQQNRPVRVKFTNMLPKGAGGNLFIPVDTTSMGAGFGPLSYSWDPMMQMFMFNGNAEMYTQNRGSIPHLHGGFTPWISDGTPHQWVAPAGEATSYRKGMSLQNVPDMPTPGPGSATLFWTNQQSARLMFFHDHAYGLTRLNVYAGVAAGYLIQDPVEQAMINGGTANGATFNAGTIPADQIPLVIEDKTFVCDATTPTTTDPSRYTKATDPLWRWGGGGSLWFPHVYMPNQDPFAPDGASTFGRWDYGPWFWPPQLPGTVSGSLLHPMPPAMSMVPEAFMDTPVVNGTAYPYLVVQPKAYRFRILNACNDRFLNLQLYYADPANPSEVRMVPALPHSTTTPAPNDGLLLESDSTPISTVTGLPVNAWPTTWPTDGRDGGVPDPLTAGPQIIQVGTEGGLLPGVALIPSCPVGYNYNRRDIVVLNVSTHALFIGPAERADLVIDFSSAPPGSTLILYNDSPAPVPGFDPRNDYYTGDPDQTSSGGAPTTLPGKGPNTRTIMQFRMAGTPSAPFNVAALQTALPTAFKACQAPPVVTQVAYGAGADTFSRIQDTSLTYAPFVQTLSVAVASGGSGYTSAPTVTFIGGGGTGATATAIVGNGVVTGVTFTPPGGNGTGYTSAPTVILTGGGGTGALAVARTAVVEEQTLSSITVTFGGTGYTSAPDVTLVGGRGAGATELATAKATITSSVASVAVTNAGTGYTSAPTVAFSGGGGGIGAAATATIAGGVVTEIIVTNPGTGYTSAPGVTLNGGGGTGAAATAAITGVVNSVWLTFAGSGYTSAPEVVFSGGGGAGAQAIVITSATVTIPMRPKAIQELFDPYGRMNATLGVEIPFTNITTQTTIPYGYIDPPTEIIAMGQTQLWKITHNGVDTHVIHFHLVNVQLVNRVGWDGMVKPPEHNELGWKETIRMNPLEDAIVALRALPPALPFKIPDSVRPLDVTTPAGAQMGFTNIDPNGNPVTVTNVMTNFGWEYVWHCHILGHEENDMMRPMIVQVTPGAPAGLSATAAAGPQVSLTWTAASGNVAGYQIQRATAGGAFAAIGTVPATTLVFTDTNITLPLLVLGGTYRYQVVATNALSSSAPSNAVTVTLSGPRAPSNLVATPAAATVVPLTVNLRWTDNSNNETNFRIERAPGAGPFVLINTVPANVTAYVDADPTLQPNTAYSYRVQAINLLGASAYSNTATVTTTAQPLAAPTNLTVVSATRTSITISWTNNVAASIYVFRSTTGAGGPWTNLTTLTAGTTKFTDTLPRNPAITYTYRVQATSGPLLSGFSNLVSSRTLP
ncbi:MAG: hypothetical protein NTW87_28020 [Planctomycetota bacterium]|nr:hypothetical protein [Planctomycetota bacterium]